MAMWQRRRVLGKETYGTVFLAEPTDPTAPPIAVKTCPIAESSSLQLEERVLARLRGCPDIVSCLGSSLTVEDDLIKKESGLCERDMRRYVRMILKGLCFVHGKGIAHCDLKPSNILVFPGEGGVLNADWLKIADFGLAKEGKEEMGFGGSTFGAPLSTCRPSRLLLVILGQRWTYGRWVVFWLRWLLGSLLCGSSAVMYFLGMVESSKFSQKENSGSQSRGKRQKITPKDKGHIPIDLFFVDSCQNF
ncbi:hypothetical protein FH972_004653 [Carpinus fangiana]|uniref:Protein kinase domain-containing protein n=1 Tax=Carpinus fangiana TaxID=176857 RepID=A0A5N6QPA3_9ROSI|nr:hypothetical protein FH972_004653 [Carpinus fangiana]